MKITLLAWNGVSHEVNIPDDTEYIAGQVISGDMVLEYPVHFRSVESSLRGERPFPVHGAKV
jgi:hypothetical protein